MPQVFNTVYAVGTDPLYYYTKSGMSVSFDSGTTWQPITTPPFDTHEGILDMADGIINWLTVSSSGGACASVGIEIDDWGLAYTFDSPPQQLNQVIPDFFALGYLAVGYQRNPTSLSEQATVQYTLAGTDSHSWITRYVHPDPHSALRAITQDPSSGDIFAVGYQQGNNPLLIWSGDGGITWIEIPVPQTYGGPLCSIWGTRSKLRIGAVGQVLTVSWDGNSAQFQGSAPLLDTQGKRKSVTFVSENFDITQPIQTIALSGSQVFYSINGFDYQSVHVPGYTFTTAVYVAGRWILGCHSLLNQYTGYYGSFVYDPDPRLVLTGFHNGVHARRFLVR